MSAKGSLFLIPTHLDPANSRDLFGAMVLDVIAKTKILLSENPRTTRRFISALQLGVPIDQIKISQLDKNTSPAELGELLGPLRQGNDMGLVSEAGMPCIADPGNIAVAYAHEHDLPVVPLPGPTSILQALIASGFNGQQFTFHGYVPIDKEQRKRFLIRLQREVDKTGYTQLFMETPYRNQKLITDLMRFLDRNTKLSIAAGITGKNEFIKTRTVEKWLTNPPDIQKIPAIFSIGI